MIDAITGIDWLAVGVATIAYYLLGAVWFSPLFGKVWDASLGFERPPRHRFPPAYYVIPLVGSLIVTIATAALVVWLDIDRLSDAAALGALVGVGYAGAISFTNALTPTIPRPFVFGAVTGSYHAAGAVIVSVVVTALR
jgi:hypothetical protein